MVSSASSSLGDGLLSNAWGLFSIVGAFIGIFAFYFAYIAVYNVFFHPLKHIPGPLLARISGTPYALRMRSGNIAPWVRKNHEKYGDVVRLAPGEVSFISGETAWQDIYGFRTGKHKATGAYLKDRSWFPRPLNGVYSIIGSDESAHSRMRRSLAHAFSDKALRDQESLMQQYVDLLVARLGEHAAEGKDLDIMRWYNYTTFDIVADLTFGEPLYCLRDSEYHSWVTLVFGSIKALGLTATRQKYPMFDYYDKLKNLFVDTAAASRIRATFMKLVREKVERRLESEKERPDFFSFILKNNETEGKGMTRDEMDSNAITLLAAGSETTATTLTGSTYLLLRTPAAYNKLVHEIRSKFTSVDQITIEEVNKLDYTIACLQEGLRLYPPVATGFPRVVPKGGDHISGRYIPEGTSVYVSQHAANLSERNFKDAEKYVPERWMGAEEFKDDRRDVVNAFSFGPRNCVGKNLAYAEMRLILVKVLFSFDLHLVDPSLDWLKDQKLFTLWEKPSLQVKVTPVRR